LPGNYLKGALIELTPGVFGTGQNVVVFQYNPESIVHTWSQPESADAEVLKSNPLAVKGQPGETFGFTIYLDANDPKENPQTAGAAVAMDSGIYARLAALELLLFPVSGSSNGLVGTVTSQSSGGSAQSVPPMQIPMLLFVWGPNRQLPVRLTGLTITEKIYDANLNPTQAEAKIDLKVLTPEDFKGLTGADVNIATAAYSRAQSQRLQLAQVNMTTAEDSTIGATPF
jgi:hypothetical protein